MVTVKNMLSVVRVTQMAARKTESLSFWVPVAVCWTRRGGAVTMAASFVCQTFLQFWRETWKKEVKYMDGRVEFGRIIAFV